MRVVRMRVVRMRVVRMRVVRLPGPGGCGHGRVHVCTAVVARATRPHPRRRGEAERVGVLRHQRDDVQVDQTAVASSL